MKKILVFLSIVIMGMISLAMGQNPTTYIPERAFDYRDDLYNEIHKLIPEMPDYNFVPSLIEHESCISLKHSKCWNANSVLSNKREHSIGFFQIAKAYNADGSVRMDTLGSLKRKYKTELSNASWDNLHLRPDLQIRAGVLLIRDNWVFFRGVPDPKERMYFVDAAHNSGAGNVEKDRRACNLQIGCDPNVWYGNVELTCTRSKKPIPAYGNRSFCDINRNHVTDVLKTRLPKYQKQYFNEEYIKTR